MIRTNSTQKTKQVVLQNGQVQSLSPFNSAIRLSSHYQDAPSTPQRQIVSQNALRLIVNNHQGEVRQSNAFTPNSKQQQTGKCYQENRSVIVQDNTRMQQLINENMYLSQALEQTKNELKQHQQSTHESQQLDFIKVKIESLEKVIDDQALEIDQWKEKYQKVCTQDPQDSMLQMESQIMLVIQENERLNILVKNIQDSTDKKDQLISQQDQEIKKLKDKIKISDKTIQSQKEEIKQWHDNFAEFEKNSKQQVSHESELLKSKMKIQELEFQLHKKKVSENNNGQKLSQRKFDENPELELKLRQLLEENNKLTLLIETLQNENTKLKSNKQSRSTSCFQSNHQLSQGILEQITQELFNQQLFSTEEFKKLKMIYQQNETLRNQLDNANEQISILKKTLSYYEEEQNVPSDQLFEEFLQSQSHCISMIKQLQQ
ncbi:unnamed protein product [Paramecium sonneborni]|uniref:Uncharacterized protein n=1 Tax=Paramecium sonneborni TaxID=65129 RepID=A0A8S1M8R4_9CILI|nr:unnamed protein product [Paramecium sonneborni]